MNIVRIFRHVACEGPGYLAVVLERHHIPFETIHIDEGQPVPGDLEGVGALAFMGGPMSVNDALPWIEPELDLIRRAADRGIPVLGHCLGGQLISKALGGQIAANPVTEIGWHPVARSTTDVAEQWMGGLPPEFEVFHWHGETFSLPQGAEGILSNEHCARQGFVMGNVLALQCHVEMTAEMVTEWVHAYRDELEHPSEALQSAEQILDDLDGRIRGLQRAADRLYERWLEPLRNA